MKVKPLVSCILFLILVTFSLSTAVQATEYREVKAEKILKQIENDEDVDYTGYHIKGELNTSKIKLKTVPNKKSRFNKNNSVIKSNIKIANSIFENDVNFSNTLFENSVLFSHVNFNNSACFYGSSFNNTADFSQTNFNSYAYFSGASFSSYATFMAANFYDDADFSQTNFNSYAYFSGASFNSDATFMAANFYNDADFSQTNFNSDAYFSGASFNSDACFAESNFNWYAEFTKSNFNSNADFSKANFSSADFSEAIFNSYADFSKANFSTAGFSKANFKSNADFSQTNISFYANFVETNFNSDAKLTGPERVDNIFTDGKSCDSFRKSYESKTQYEKADTIYYNYRDFYQDDKGSIPLSNWSDFVSWATCGYGLKPLRILWIGVLIVGFFACLFWQMSGIYRSSDIDTKQSEVSFWDALYFSINTFTTLGSADWYPKDNFRKWVTLEGLCGWISLGIFMSSLANILIR